MQKPELQDTGERMIPTGEGELSFVYSRHRFAYEYALEFVADKSVLDVGCGTGYGCKLLSSRANKVTGVDQSSEAIDYCKKHYAGANIEYCVMDGNTLSLATRFDVVVCYQVIEHMRDVQIFLEQLKSVTAPGGLILITTPNVIIPETGADANPFHFNEMNYEQFTAALAAKFDDFDVYGIGYSTPNRLRTLLGKMPFYKWGRMLGRKSRLKKVASKALDLTSFTILTTGVKKNAADLLGICRNV